MQAQLKHEPVMVEEILKLLPLEPGAVVADGTLGLAGHARRFAERITPGGTLAATDWDEAMLDHAREVLGNSGVNLVLFHDDFRSLAERLEEIGLHPDAILLDLGLNSAQIDDPERGISFAADGPLDMRMDRSRGETAAAWLNRATPSEIENVLHTFGDERWARAIARKVLERRKTNPLRRTGDLVECVLEAVPPAARDKRIHPATRTFQAVRIHINQELQGLDDAIADLAKCLTPLGVFVVLSYHSGEDRLVKRAFRELSQGSFLELVKKPMLPSEDEIRRNPRSRSAKLRALQRSAG